MTFSDITRSFPAERATIGRLEELLRSGSWGSRTFDHLVADTQPTSEASLALILEQLAAGGVLRHAYRIYSHGSPKPIDEVNTWSDIPDEIHDSHTGSLAKVELDDVKVIY